MKFQIGYQDNRAFIAFLHKHKERFPEIYFPWGDFTTGRGIFTGDAARERLSADLRGFADAGFRLCLNFCSARTFHDNLVAHQHESVEMDNAFIFKGECSVFLAKEENRENFLSRTNFIRPEDVPLYEELCDGMKLATRTNFNPLAVASAYLDGRWQGNLPDLTEPAHSELFRPQIISGAKFPADYAKIRFNCDKRCESCSYCRDVQKNATVTPAREAAFLE